MSRIQQINFSELEQLYGEYGPAAYSLAFKILRDPVTAEIVVQDVFLEYWRVPYQLRPEKEEFLYWLMVRVRQKSLDHRQPYSPQSTLTVNIAGNPARPNPGLKAGPGYLKPGTTELKVSLEALPGDQKRIIELAFFTGLNNRQISEALGLPIMRVKYAIRQGLTLLKGETGAVVI